MPHPQRPPATTATVEPNRLRLILQRLQERFYESEPASVRIATAVLAEVKDSEEDRSALPS